MPENVAALQTAASKPLKSADKARQRAGEAGNFAKPSREAFATIREKIRGFMEPNRQLINS
jgi:hypothetical protein